MNGWEPVLGEEEGDWMCISPHEETALLQTADPDAAKRVYVELREIIIGGRITDCEPWGQNIRQRDYYLFVTDGVRSAYRVVPAVYADGHHDLRYNKWRADADVQRQPDGRGIHVAIIDVRRHGLVLSLYVGRGDNKPPAMWHRGGRTTLIQHHRIPFNVDHISPSILQGVDYARSVGNWAQLPG